MKRRAPRADFFTCPSLSLSKRKKSLLSFFLTCSCCVKSPRLSPSETGNDCHALCTLGASELESELSVTAASDRRKKETEFY
jgi:hypothetical protein